MAISFWENKKITVTGGKGFLGSHMVDRLKEYSCKAVNIAGLPEYDLTIEQDIKRMIKDQKPDIIIHLAAAVGGIGANQENPGKYFYDNAMMGIQLIHQSYLCGIEKFIGIGTVCAYPKYARVPFKEEDLWNGYPEETNAPYGIAKKNMLVQSAAYREQYDFNSIFLIPVNLYGPRDNFDLTSSHVIPAMMRKFYEAKQNKLKQVSLWGDGSPTREFLYVEDAVDGILFATEKYNISEAINLGSGQEISIKNLAQKVAKICGFKGGIHWDDSKPNGQPRRKLDTKKAEIKFGFKSSTDFDEGLENTYQWYLENRLKII
jgi:GDP-L-fucose synthase